MGIRFPGRAEIDPSAPRALGICDRCGFQYNLNALRPQPAWAGTRLINTGFLVCDRCYDIPNEQLRSIRLPPDPEPVFNTRPENFDEAEKNYLTIQKYVTASHFYSGRGSMAAELESTQTIIAALDGAGEMTAVPHLGLGLSATLDGAGEMDAGLQRDAVLTAAMDGAGEMAAELDQVAPSGISRLWTDAFLIDDTAPFTEAGVAIGSAAADRQVFVFVAGVQISNGDEITSVEIGGITAKRVTIERFSLVGILTGYIDCWWAAVPTGTTASIEFDTTPAASGLVTMVEVYAVYGADAAVPVWDWITDYEPAGLTVSAALNIPADSVTIGMAFLGLYNTATTSSWTNLTEDDDFSEAAPTFGANVDGGAASRADTVAPGSVTFTATVANADTPTNAITALDITADPGDVWIALTAGSSFSVPADWNNADNSIHAIGASPNATDPVAVGGGGCGGGAWARTDNLTLTPGGSATYQIGVPGTVDTWLSNTGVTPVSTATGVLAKGGTANALNVAGVGGASASCIGHAANSGGGGGAGSNAANGTGGGGGGAGGPNGVGANGAAGTGTTTTPGGGGGANGGTAGSTTTGGSSRNGVPTAAGNGNNGLYGGGGSAKTGAGTGAIALGSTDPVWIDDATGALIGPGGGGGGGSGIITAAATGGQGGLYGGAPGGSGEDAAAHGAGRNGVLMIRYRPVP